MLLFPLLASQHCSNDRRFKAYTTLSNTENKYEPQKHVNASISVVSLLCFLVSTNVSQPSMELSNHIFSWEKKNNGTADVYNNAIESKAQTSNSL